MNENGRKSVDYHVESLLDYESELKKSQQQQKEKIIKLKPKQEPHSFEMIKVFDENIQIAIKLDSKEDYLYVATLHEIKNSKIENRLNSGRLKKLRKIDIITKRL